MRLGFVHTYATLPERCYARSEPTPVADPRLVVFNAPLAVELGLDAQRVQPLAAAMFSGNQLPEDAEPLAMAYAGHQFGTFVPRLGDGRALLLGELRGRDGALRDVQLKGAGPTPFSRNGDGRATIGPMLREYLVSEAMHALGIPTTRSLAVVSSGEQVWREKPLPGAVLTRVAASHLRVGTFQYFAARQDREALQALLDYVITRHYPQAREATSPALAVLQAVAQRQAALIAGWMSVGFIHGVMNTDNMAISGETIDYGPCAFLDHYDSNQVFSSIDSGGRYRFANQPAIAQWNLARLADTLLPLIDADEARAVDLATEAVRGFGSEFDEQFLARMRRKLGFFTAMEGDADLISRLLASMQRTTADFTLIFRGLASVAQDPGRGDELLKQFSADSNFATWLAEWTARLAADREPAPARIAAMRAANPAFIPRNHRVEAALTAAESGNYGPFNSLLTVLQRPFDDQPGMEAFAVPPDPGERVLQTFCGT
ncbi:MAG: YdiU family protein [Proteobacteria bacterium]|nr:YdiU family protein [Pseudomonadota bacterium]